MTLYIQPNETVFPTTNVLTVEKIQYMTWLGFSTETTAEQIEAVGFIPVAEPAGTQPNDTTLVVDKNQNGEYVATWVANTEYQQFLYNKTAEGSAKLKRNVLLKETDWTQHSDVSPSIAAAWAPYREALRNLTKQEGFPTTIVWPTAPTEFKEVVDEPITPIPGPAGKDGKDGQDGAPGRDGLPGAVGPQGPAGVQGVAGPKGDTGAQGIQGPKGDTGAQGPAGPAGKDGLPGATGPQGVAGPAGKDGVSITNVAITAGKLIITKSDGTTVDAGAVTATTTAPAVGGPPVVGSAPNPFAPIVVTSPQGYKAASLDDGVELTLDTIAVQLPTAGARSLQFRVTSGTMSVNISGQSYWGAGNYTGNYSALYWNGNTLNTTYQQIFTWSFPWQGDVAIYNVQDLTNRRLYRITLTIGAGYKKNFIVMERLV